MRKVSVVILNWNGAEMLRTFLPSVVKYTNPELAEVCVADNGSTDNSVDIVRNEFPSVRLIPFKDNYGFAEGYNKVMNNVDTDYVVLLNSDVEVTEGWIEPILSYMESHKDVAACQPKILSYHDKKKFEYAGASGGYIDKYGYPFCRGRVFDSLETDNGQYDTPADIFWASGAAMFVRREVYVAVGGLDPKFFAHMEEIDLCWRLLSRGYRLVCIPESKVYHVGGATLKKENPKKTYLNFRNNLLMMYKNLPSDELRKVMIVRCFLDYLAVVFYILKFDFSNAFAVVKARKDYSSMRKDFKSLRDENLRQTKRSKLKFRYDFSLILQSKTFGKTTYSRLVK
ncbi:glycosyltransferase family 2 protein [Bacteroides sp.]|uniref:glycosyltransferase family 2 protein n=1 Tax=Bacteroides sp. TaxID=29523 RepID=UPI0025BF71CE|nr:glycosyltransferase family 2 protein [Bacteroides sp.]